MPLPQSETYKQNKTFFLNVFLHVQYVCVCEHLLNVQFSVSTGAISNSGWLSHSQLVKYQRFGLVGSTWEWDPTINQNFWLHF